MEEILAKEKLENSLLTVGDYLDIGWTEFRKNMKTFVAFVLLINLPITLMQSYIEFSLDSETGDFTGNPAIAIIFFPLSMVLGLLASLAIPKVVERSVIYGKSLDAITAIKNSTPKILIMLLVSIVLSLLIGIGFIFLIIPGIWLAIRYGFTYQAIALRDCGFNAMSYSQSLVQNRWWLLFKRFFLLTVYAILIFLPLAFIGGIIVAVTGALGLGMIVQIIFSLIVAFFSYYFVAIYTLIFLNFDYTRQ